VECDSTHLGESVGVVGECEELGIWEKAVRMTTDYQQWPRWKVNVTLNHQYAGSLAYKYVKLSANDSIIQWEWESGDNRHICTKNPKDSKGSDLKAFDGSFGYTLIPTTLAWSSILSSQFPTAGLEEEGTAVNEHGEALTPIYQSLPPVNDVHSTEGGRIRNLSRRAHIFSPRVPGSFRTATAVALQVALSFSLPRFLSLFRLPACLSARPPAHSRYIALSRRPF
jgi:hypothetical protein